MESAGSEGKWYPGFLAFNIFMGKRGKDAIIDKYGEKIIFLDYRENDLAKWIRKQNRDRLILSRETLYAMKNVGFPFVKSSNERNDESYAALVAYKEKQGNLLILQLHKQLGGTVKNLRVAYKAHQKGEKSSLTSECIQNLDDIRFVWVLLSTWKSKHDFLVEYAKKERNCKVPQTYAVKDVNLGR